MAVGWMDGWLAGCINCNKLHINQQSTVQTHEIHPRLHQYILLRILRLFFFFFFSMLAWAIFLLHSISIFRPFFYFATVFVVSISQTSLPL